MILPGAMAYVWRESHARPQIAVTHATRRSCAHEAPAEGLAVQEKDDDAEDDGSVLSSLLDEMRPYVLRRVKAHVCLLYTSPSPRDS